MKYEIVISMPGATPYRKTFTFKGDADAYMRSLADNNPGALAYTTMTRK
jgi:hypothetical protein